MIELYLDNSDICLAEDNLELLSGNSYNLEETLLRLCILLSNKINN